VATLDERLARIQKGTLEQRLARAQAANPLQTDKPETASSTVSAKFRLPNGTSGTMTGATKEDVLRRIDVLRVFYLCCELTNETHDVLMPNGKIITDCPVGYTAQDIYLLADAVVSIVEQVNEFALFQQLKSRSIH